MSQVLKQIQKELRDHADPAKAAFFPGFFKASYSKNDKFLGVTVPKQRTVVKKYQSLASLDDIKELLASPWHEERLTALFLLVWQFKKTSDKKTHVDFYLANKTGVNNWDLVDSSAYHILGTWLLDKDRRLLYEMAKSPDIWERRIAIVATMAFIRAGQTTDTFKIAEVLLNDKEDLIQKAVGWLLREAGKKDNAELKKFLDKYHKTMPRTMLRYAIERFDEQTRKHYLGKGLIHVG